MNASIQTLKVNGNIQSTSAATRAGRRAGLGGARAAAASLALLGLLAAPASFAQRLEYADLSVTNTVSEAAPQIESLVTFSVAVVNAGPRPAAAVVLRDRLPSGYAYVAHAVSRGAYAPANGKWGGLALGVGDSATLAITARVMPGGDYRTVAEVMLSAIPDPDSVPGNGRLDEDDLAARNTEPRLPNVAPVIDAQAELRTPEETPLTIALTDFTVTDPDSVFPDDFTLTVLPGAGYTLTDANEITPDLDFTGDLVVPVQVNDGRDDSAPFLARVTVFLPLPARGCPKAHCDRANSNWSDVPVPPRPVEIVWTRAELPGEVAGSSIGLSCSADGEMAVCTYAGTSDNVVAYDYDGNRLWSSGSLLNATTFTSVPLILADGDVLIADNRQAVKYDRFGNLRWITALPRGGKTISPVITSDGVLVLGTSSGPVYAVDSRDGTLLAYLYIKDGADDPGYFHTHKSAAVRGNRVYLSTEHLIGGELDPAYLGWLVALDIDGEAPDPADRIKVAWHYEFGAESKSSPLIMHDVIYFDGERPGPGVDFDPHIFAVRDTGPAPLELWTARPVTQTRAGFAADPRPGAGFWYLQTDSALMTRRAASDGAILETIDLGQPTTSAISFMGTTAEPVIIVATAAEGRGRVLAVDLSTSSLKWALDLGLNAIAPGQFPQLIRGEDVRIVTTTESGGARAIGAAP